MLGTRIVTAVVLLALLLPALFAAAAWPFVALTLVFIAAAGWEWARLSGLSQGLALLLALAVGAAGLLAWRAGWAARAPQGLWLLAALGWLVGGAFALRAGVAAWGGWPRALRLVIGFGVLWLAWLALSNGRSLGLNYLLSALCLVWVADIAAYFGGRTFGRRKLALTISPGKTWEGAVSGAIGVVIVGLVWMLWIDRQPWVDSQSIYSEIRGRFGWAGFFAGSLLLCAASVVGDLFESLVKRSAGAKDSSRLLPGHGGVLDRIDALLPTLPLALALTVVGR